MKYLNESEQQELLELEAENYLYLLCNHTPTHMGEHPDIYRTDGKLMGMCGIFNATFRVELRRKITFYKYKNKDFDEKFWFEIENENVTEKEAERIIKKIEDDNREFSELIRRIF